jgi:hypothetical protein
VEGDDCVGRKKQRLIMVSDLQRDVDLLSRVDFVPDPLVYVGRGREREKKTSEK